MGEAVHLTRRFFASLRPGGPAEVDRAWVETVLSHSEYELWERLYPPDRRHSAFMARRVQRELGGGGFVGGAPLREDMRWVLAAALLHDVGKIESGLGTWGRVSATIAAKVLGAEYVAGWIGRGGWRGRVGRYLNHPEIGAELLRGARSNPCTVAWASQHHKPSDSWTLPVEIAQILHEFDND